MKKIFTAATCALLSAALVTPALALENKVSGFLLIKGVMQNVDLVKDAKPDKYFDQRFRAKWDIIVNEYVSLTYYAEVDFQWGDASYNVPDGNRGRNGGGRIGGDSTNVETKNLYMSVKIPDTPVDFRLGLQGFASPDYALFLFDGAGLTVNAKMDMFSGQFGYAKLIEGDTSTNGQNRVEAVGAVNGENDADFYYLKASAKPIDPLQVGGGLYWVRNRFSTGTSATSINFASNERDLDFDEYFLVLDGSYKLDMLTISGWAATAFGTVEDGTTDNNGNPKDVDLGGYAATVKVAGKVSGIGFGARVLYWSGDDDANDDSYDGLYVPFAAVSNARETAPFMSDGLMLMLADANTITTGGPGMLSGVAMDAAYRGWGLFGLTVNGSFAPPALPKAYVKGALGYFMTLEDDQTPGDGHTDMNGKSLGTEIAVRAGYKLADAVDLSINGAYAMLGDFFDETAVNDQDPDDLYTVYLMAKVAF